MTGLLVAVSLSDSVSPISTNPISAMLVLAGLTLLPFIFVMLTSFLKIVVVLSILRTALGTPQVPPSIVVTGLAVILSVYVMAPTGVEAYQAARTVLPDQNAVAERGVAGGLAALKASKEPVRRFLWRNSGRADRATFLDLARRSWSKAMLEEINEEHFLVVVPAFVVGQLALAFQIGFILFVPFLVVDLVVANSLLALGMHMLSPTTVSLPFKLLLFVMVDGWRLISQGLILSFG